MELKDLTNEQLTQIYNANFEENLSEQDLDFERSAYGTIEIHKIGFCDDMMLTISDKGSIYLYCLDNGEIYNDVFGALKKLKEFNVNPFS